MVAEEHLTLMRAAVDREAQAQRAALTGDWSVSRAAFAEAAAGYRASWEAAPPGSYGRLVGMLKAAVLSSDAAPAARYADQALGDAVEQSPTAAYAAALAALVLGNDADARAHAAAMGTAPEAFARAAAAIDALACSDGGRYRVALAAIVADFETREEHLTGVAIADTALMLDRLAAARGMAVNPLSALLPNLSPGR